MPINFRISALVPVGPIVESVAPQLDDSILVTARAGILVATYPLYRSPSRRVHSRYVREVSDLPCSGRSVRLEVVTRRFCCDAPHCRRRIFAERFDKTVLLVRSRRTSRLDCVVHHLGLALGGSELRQTTDATSARTHMTETSDPSCAPSTRNCNLCGEQIRYVGTCRRSVSSIRLRFSAIIHAATSSLCRVSLAWAGYIECGRSHNIVQLN